MGKLINFVFVLLSVQTVLFTKIKGEHSTSLHKLGISLRDDDNVEAEKMEQTRFEIPTHQFRKKHSTSLINLIETNKSVSEIMELEMGNLRRRLRSLGDKVYQIFMSNTDFKDSIATLFKGERKSEQDVSTGRLFAPSLILACMFAWRRFMFLTGICILMIIPSIIGIFTMFFSNVLWNIMSSAVPVMWPMLWG